MSAQNAVLRPLSHDDEMKKSPLASTLSPEELAAAKGMMHTLHHCREDECAWASQEAINVAENELARRERERIIMEARRAAELEVLLEDGSEVYCMVARLGGADHGFFTREKLAAAYGGDVSKLFERIKADGDGATLTHPTQLPMSIPETDV